MQVLWTRKQKSIGKHVKTSQPIFAKLGKDDYVVDIYPHKNHIQVGFVMLEKQNSQGPRKLNVRWPQQTKEPPYCRISEQAAKHGEFTDENNEDTRFSSDSDNQ